MFGTRETPAPPPRRPLGLASSGRSDPRQTLQLSDDERKLIHFADEILTISESHRTDYKVLGKR